MCQYNSCVSHTYTATIIQMTITIFAHHNMYDESNHIKCTPEPNHIINLFSWRTRSKAKREWVFACDAVLHQKINHFENYSQTDSFSLYVYGITERIYLEYGRYTCGKYNLHVHTCNINVLVFYEWIASLWI